MGFLKVVFMISLISLVSGDNGVIPGPATPPANNNTTTSTTAKPTSTTPTTAKPTTSTTSPTTSTTTTSKPTTATTTTSRTTTSKPTTASTTAKPTTPTPVNPIGKWSLNYTNTNRTCLMLEGALEVDLKYQIGNETKNATIKIPSTAVPQGGCGDKIENLTLTFSIPNSINFNFKKSSDNKSYEIESVIIMLNLQLPGVNDSKIYLLAHNKSEFSTPVSNSYKCAKEQTLSLTPETSHKDYTGLLRISSFQVQAFRNETNTKFDDALDCATYETPDIVPVAVGCALAALIIIVLIGYLYGRRRSQARGYLSM